MYDTAYHKLGESGGGGTTLNKYTYTTSDSVDSYLRFLNIISNAKSIKYIRNNEYDPVNFSFNVSNNLVLQSIKMSYSGTYNSMTISFKHHIINKTGAKKGVDMLTITNKVTDGNNVLSSSSVTTANAYIEYVIEYYNETEITQ